MAKSKNPVPVIPNQPPRNRFAGDASEGSAWGAAFGSAQPDAAPAPEPIDLTDPDAKLAWMEMLADATAAGDNEQVAILQAMLPDAAPTA